MKKRLRVIMLACVFAINVFSSHAYATEKHPEIVAKDVTAEDIIASCQKVGQIMTDAKIQYAWKDYMDLRQPNLPALLEQNHKFSHCGDYVSYVLQDLGLLSDDLTFVADGYGNVRASYILDGMPTYAGPKAPESKEVKKELWENFHIIKAYKEGGKSYRLAGKKVRDAVGLKQGDIVFMCKQSEPTKNIYACHLMIYDSGEGEHTLWYNGGSARINAEGYLDIGTEPHESKYNDWYITRVIRLKSNFPEETETTGKVSEGTSEESSEAVGEAGSETGLE